MKKLFTILAVAAALAFVSCDDGDDYQKGQSSGSITEEPEELLPAKDGRVAIAYVTWYGKAIPDPTVMTHICYAFAELYVRDGVYQGFKLQGNEDRFRQVVALKKKNPKLKISLSFSHTVDNSDNWQGGGFSALAKSDEYRKAFAKDCRDFCSKWGIDGIDMDWEFPGLSWSGHACDPAVDVENHVLLMKQLRETLGTRYLLTYAGYGMDAKTTSDGGRRYIDIAGVDPYVDWVNIMTYDLDAAPNHQSALKDKSAYLDCDRAIKAYLNAGVAPSKLVLGIPFYGRHSFDSSPSAIDYNKIILLDKSIYKIDNWDNEASVPYVTENGKYYCGYDNPKSIGIKGDWIRGLGMKGMMYWDYNADDNQHTLCKAVWQAVMK
ncbi:MAG: glycoside hydrolase family 18 [Rikenellaceae bacterium]|nr:glycoside hydrolase family 18 [Rikenellaceae bacterium]